MVTPVKVNRSSFKSMGRPKKNQVSATIQKIYSLPGTEDIISDSDELWGLLLKKINYFSKIYGFSRVETPLIEDASLYEALNIKDPGANFPLGSKTAAVRTNILPSVLRAYYQNKVYEKALLSKWSFGGQVMRLDRKQQPITDYQFGFEVFGGFNHLTEAQVVAAVWQLLESLGLSEVVLEINTIGNSECQSSYQESFKDYLEHKKFDLCDDCNEHLSGRVLNILRCTNVECQTIVSEAPTILDFLDEESHKHFTAILEALDEMQIPYQLNPLYVGLEGVSKTNISFKLKIKQQTITLGEGGYHDDMVAKLCGKPYRAFGFNGSLKKLYQAMRDLEMIVEREQTAEVCLVPLGELAAKKSLRLFRDLTASRVVVYDHFGSGGVKNQLKQAELFKSPIALIMGQKEALDEMVILRDVKSGMQELFSYDKIVEEVKKRLGK